jgi:hypothetical protein
MLAALGALSLSPDAHILQPLPSPEATAVMTEVARSLRPTPKDDLVQPSPAAAKEHQDDPALAQQDARVDQLWMTKEEDWQLLQQHPPRLVISFGCSASTLVLHLASSVLSALGTPTGTICDSPKALMHKERCRLGTPSTDELLRCQNNWYCKEDDDEAQGLKEAALALARQGQSLLFKGPGSRNSSEWRTPVVVSLLQAAQAKGVALARCNKIDKFACDTRSCIEFVKYGHTVDLRGRPTTECINDGHAANGDVAEKKALASLDLQAGGAIDTYLHAERKGKRKPRDERHMLETLRSNGFGGGYECSEDLLAFTAKGGERAEEMHTSVQAWARFATHLGACESATACDVNAIRNALRDSGHEGTYDVPDTCDVVHNCDELKEALMLRGTPVVRAMFRPQADLHN